MERKNGMNQKALLVVSFGTSYEETRKKTIDKIEEDLAASFPDRRLYRAWTSKMIIKKLKNNFIYIISIASLLKLFQKECCHAQYTAYQYITNRRN